MRITFFLCLFVLVFFNQRAQASLPEDLPASYCDPEYYNCSEFSQTVTANYWQAQRPAMNFSELLAIGSCHMVNSSLAPGHEHFGHVYFKEISSGQFAFFGEFAFFTATNPYLDLTLERARSQHQNDEAYAMELAEHSLLVKMTEKPPWIYYIRQAQEHLYVIGFWGGRESITCDLQISKAPSAVRLRP